MPQQLKLPELSETVRTGIVSRVLVTVGDRVEEGQAVLEVETDKAVVEVPSTLRGIVKEIHVKAGDEVSVGQALLTVEPEAAEPELEAAEPEAPRETTGVGDDAAQGSGESAEPAETAPAGVAPPAAEAPTAELVPPGEVEPPAPVARPESLPRTDADGQRRLVPAAPSVRRFARELGVDIHEVPGSGPGGRISIDDVKAYVRQRQQVAPEVAPSAVQPLPDFSRWGPIERVPMSGVRRATARQVARAWVTVPHVTHYDRADATELERLRKRYASKVEAAGGKLTVTAILVKIVASALKVYPKFNSSIDLVNQQLIYKKYYHIGVAVDTEYGLLVPVIRDVDRKNLIEIAVELHQLSQRARERKLTAEEMQGGTFTVSNLGGIGGTNFAPIVNEPEVAILGVSRYRIEPVYVDDAFQPRLMLPLSLSYDHRVIDGADAARFLRWVCEAIEEPFLMAVEG